MQYNKFIISFFAIVTASSKSVFERIFQDVHVNGRVRVRIQARVRCALGLFSIIMVSGGCLRCGGTLDVFATSS
jgi:hypothetical protein